MEIKVITLNLRYDKPDPDDYAWRIRKQAVAALITHSMPDIVGTQEGKAHQLLDLHRALPDYFSVGGDRTGTGADEYCAIFYNTQRLRCLSSGDFFLSNTPEIPGSLSPNWGNPIPRMVSWAVFALMGGDKRVTVFNTHLDYKSEKARELSAQLLRDRFSQLNPDDSYLFLTGDFNAAPGTLPRELLQYPLSNGLILYDALADVALENQLSFHDFTGEAFVAVDTLYHDSRVKIQQIKVDNQRWQGIWPSDHFPVVADFIV